MKADVKIVSKIKKKKKKKQKVELSEEMQQLYDLATLKCIVAKVLFKYAWILLPVVAISCIILLILTL